MVELKKILFELIVKEVVFIEVDEIIVFPISVELIEIWFIKVDLMINCSEKRVDKLELEI